MREEINFDRYEGETFLERTEREFLELQQLESKKKIEIFVPMEKRQPCKDLTELYVGMSKYDYYKLIDDNGHPVNWVMPDDHDYLLDLPMYYREKRY